MGPQGVCAVLCAAALGVCDWPHWRGPHYDGSAEASGLPTSFGPDENVVWAAELPGQSAATPVVANGRVFLSSLDDHDAKLLALCLDRATGELVWDRLIGEGRVPSERSRGRENTLAACSPVTDGERVVFLYGTGDLVAFDLAGKQLWRKALLAEGAQFNINWGYASSPLLHDGTLYVQVLQRDAESYLMGLDPATGEQRFKALRPNEARAESQEAYTTPIPFANGDRTDVLVLGGDCLTGHDPQTGKERWRWCGLNPLDRPIFRAVSNPVALGGGMVLVTSPQHNAMHGLRVAGDAVEEVWSYPGKPSPDATTPLLYRGLVYAVDGKRQVLLCMRPETGEIVYQEELGTETFLRASPTGADGKVWIMDAEGNVVVVRAGETFEVLGRAAFDSYPSRSSIVVDADQLLVRTASKLYCIGAEASGSR